MVIPRGRELHFSTGMRLNVIADGNVDHVVGQADDLMAAGLTSPAPLRWHRLNIRLRPGLSVFLHYLPEGQASAETPPAPR